MLLSISPTMLRGLPSTEIVGHAVRHHGVFKFASEIFLERPPDEAAAAALIEAAAYYEQKKPGLGDEFGPSFVACAKGPVAWGSSNRSPSSSSSERRTR
jgi:hypothetical protein